MALDEWNTAELELGFDVPAHVGLAESEIETPCLIVDLAAFERNVATMKQRAAELGVVLRVHGKMHKSSAVARYQMAHGGAVGVCCQKVSEAEAFVRGGVPDVLISNQVTRPSKLDRLAQLAGRARVSVCVDDLANISDLSAAAVRHGTEIDVLVEIDVGAGRCGVTPGDAALPLAHAIVAAEGLTFAGLQSYNGSAQHIRDHAERRATVDRVIADTQRTVDALDAAGIACSKITGAGTGSFAIEGASGLFTEIQCGSYAFMDADYRRVRDADGAGLAAFEHALFILTSVMSHAKPDVAVCDAGLKSQSVDSGLPVVFGRDDVTYKKCSDEHGVIDDPSGALAINDQLRLVPGHCDPTCNVHDWYVGVRDGKVECLWPIDARGKGY